MADMTITPAALELALTQQAITLPGVDHTSAVSTLALALTLPTPKIIISFPGLSRKPGQVFSDEPSSKAVQVGDVASGYSVLNKLVTFDPRNFVFELPSVVEADKLTVMGFYKANKDKVFPWYNYQDKTWYDVIFVTRPLCRLDGRGDLWTITLHLRQDSP